MSKQQERHLDPQFAEALLGAADELVHTVILGLGLDTRLH